MRATYPTFNWSADGPTSNAAPFYCEYLPGNQSPAVTYECHKFIPALGDEFNRELRTGDMVTIIEMPPYAIVSCQDNHSQTASLIVDQV